MTSKTYSGGCHCGAIVYRLHWPLPGDPPVRTCGCTFCVERGAVYAAHPEATLAVTIADGEKLGRYRFGTGTADFCFCARCGSYVFVLSTIDDRAYAGINVRTLREFPIPAKIEVRNFEGETEEGRLARRRRTWIGTVIIAGQPCA